jgi:transcriptional regulator with XRE-family HTH domain
MCCIYVSGMWACPAWLIKVGGVNTERSAPLVDPAWWRDPRLRPSLAVCDVGALFRWLNARGWSQVQIASATGQTQPEVSAIMKGREVKAQSVLLRIARGLRIPLGYMRLSSCTICDDDLPDERPDQMEGDEAMLRRQFLAAAGALAAGGVAFDGVQRLLPEAAHSMRAVPDRVGASEVAQARAITAQLRRLDYQYGHGTALDAARGFAGWAHRLLGAQQSMSTAGQLRIALADLHAMIAWAFHDSGRYMLARRHHLQALLLAREASEPALAGTILGDMAKASVDNGDPRDGSRLAGYGLLATEYDDVSPAVRAGLYLEEAWARAHLADEHGVLDSLARAAEDLARTDTAAVPPWASTALRLLEGGGHAGLRGQVYVALARTPTLRRYAETGVEETQTAVAAYDGRRPVTGHVLDRLSLAAGLLYTGVLDDGAYVANDILDKAAEIRSTRVRTLLSDISDAAQTYAGNPDADDLRAHIAALTAA